MDEERNESGQPPTFPPGSTIPELRLRLIRRLGEPSDVGEVYEARFRDTIRRAVKLIDKDAQGVAALQSEVGMMCLVRHTNIIHISDYGEYAIHTPETAVIPEDTRFAIAMDFVLGETLDLKIPSDERHFVALLDQLLGAISYLHERGILHMDVKLQNVMVTSDTHEVVLIDLGYSLVADKDRFLEAVGADEPTAAILTRSTDVYLRFTRENAAAHFGDLWRTTISRTELEQQWFPHHDLYALGHLLKKVLETPEGRSWPSIRPGLQLVTQALLDFDSDYHKIAQHLAAAQVLRDIRKLYPEYLSPLGIQEFAADVEGSEQITLSLAPVHVPPRSKQLVEHPLFQRLRLLPQLERIDYVYPDARQTRFSHSLLTFSYCRQALRFLLVHPEFRLAVEREDVQATLLLALLHDIGHYPLSHMFEDLEGFGEEVGDQVLTDDELFFPMIVGGGDASQGPLYEAIARLCETSPLDVIVGSHGKATADALLSIAGCAFRSERPIRQIHRMLAGLISSAGDVDKLAYLVGDSHFTGVPYGRGIDVWGYMRTLRVPKEALRTDDTHPLLAIDERGLKAVESVISARYGMLGRVYWHDRNRAVMAMYKDAIFRVFGSSEEPVRFSTYFHDAFWFTAAEATSYIRDRMEGHGHDGLLSDLRQGQRLICKELLALSEREDQDLYGALSVGLPADRIAELGGFVEEAVVDALQIRLRPGSIALDVPNKDRDRIHPEEIRVVRYQRTGERRKGEQPLNEASETIDKLGAEFLNQAKRVRIFVRAREYEEIDSADKIEAAAQAARGALRERLPTLE